MLPWLSQVPCPNRWYCALSDETGALEGVSCGFGFSLESDFFFEPKSEAKSPDSFLLDFDGGAGGGGGGGGGGSTGDGGVAWEGCSMRDLLLSRWSAWRESAFSLGLGRSARDADFLGLPFVAGFSLTCSSSEEVLKRRLQAPFLDCVGGGDGDEGGGGTGIAN